MDIGDTLCQNQKTEQKGNRAHIKSTSPNLSSRGEDTQADTTALFLSCASFGRPSVKPVSSFLVCASHELTNLELWRRVPKLLEA